MYRLGFLIEYRPDACLDEINAEFVQGFRRFLRKHKKDFSDRTWYNIMQAVSTFLLHYGITAAKARLFNSCVRSSSHRSTPSASMSSNV